MFLLMLCFQMWLMCGGASGHVVRRQAPPRVVEFCKGSKSVIVDIGDQTAGTVRSTNFNVTDYKNNTRCNVVFRTQDKSLLISVYFRAFNVEYQNRTCSYDKLCLNGVRFCGNWTTGQTFDYLVPANKTFTLNFETDVQISAPGFELTVTARAYNGSNVSSPASGVGTALDKLGFRLYNNSTLKDYTDKCKEAIDASFSYYMFQNPNPTMSPWINVTSVTTTRPLNTTVSPANVTTVKPLNTTTAAPVNTTAANVTTVKPLNTTTAAPINTTTAAPINTTAANITTVKPLNTTTAAPINTTTATPINTTAANVTTVKPLNTTTAAPINTTAANVTTVKPLNTTTAAPINTTTATPINTTASNVTTVKPLNTTTAAPINTTASNVTTVKPLNTTTATPLNTTTAAPINTTASNVTTVKPLNTTTAAPVNTTSPANVTTSAPVNTTTTVKPLNTTTIAQNTTTAATTTKSPTNTTASAGKRQILNDYLYSNILPYIRVSQITAPTRRLGPFTLPQYLYTAPPLYRFDPFTPPDRDPDNRFNQLINQL